MFPVVQKYTEVRKSESARKSYGKTFGKSAYFFYRLRTYCTLYQKERRALYRDRRGGGDLFYRSPRQGVFGVLRLENADLLILRACGRVRPEKYSLFLLFGTEDRPRL